MRVVCKTSELSERHQSLLKASGRFRPKHAITPGNEYLVLGIVSIIESPQYGNTPLFEIVDDARHLVLYPAALFEVTDARCSSYWRAAISDDGSLSLRPKELYQEFFHDDLSENDRATRQTLEAVITRLEAEFPESATRPYQWPVDSRAMSEAAASESKYSRKRSRSCSTRTGGDDLPSSFNSTNTE